MPTVEHPEVSPQPSLDTSHLLYHADSRDLASVASSSVSLVVTSPPYPMVEMWDGVFGALDVRVANALAAGDGPASWRLMHDVLDPVWDECERTLMPGGIACVNIGDATRTVAGEFRRYSNAARITAAFEARGFLSLPIVLWRKTTNAPNKFMGSGMLPAGAYVTLEHEYVLIFRKGGRRSFASEAERRSRRESAYFWEERNRWFSDVWDLHGVRQRRQRGGNGTSGTRERSGAFPAELAFRLVLMHSVRGDTVLDPFVGTGSTTIASIAAARNSVGADVDGELMQETLQAVSRSASLARAMTRERMTSHRAFVREHLAGGGSLRYRNAVLDVPVKTSQEQQLTLDEVALIRPLPSPANGVVASYRPVDETGDP